MSTFDGHMLPYARFRNDLKLRAESAAPVTWTQEAVNCALERAMDAEIPGLALLALSRTPELGGCETVPGVSLSVQSLGAGNRTPHHAHAWWHIYVVQSGSGLLTYGDGAPARRISLGDVVFIPGWCPHGLENDQEAPFLTLNISNMAQQADLANFRPG